MSNSTFISSHLAKVFASLNASPVEYLVLKLSDSFPFLPEGSDIDILSTSIQDICNQLNTIICDYESLRPVVKINKKTSFHVHYDIYLLGNFVLRYDIYSRIPSFKYLSIKEILFTSLINERRKKSCQIDNYSDLNVFVPSKIHDALYRYLEYCEYYWIGNEKTHHLDFCLNRLDSSELNKMYTLLHQYTKHNGYSKPNTRSELIKFHLKTFRHFISVLPLKLYKKLSRTL